MDIPVDITCTNGGEGSIAAKTADIITKFRTSFITGGVDSTDQLTRIFRRENEILP